MECGELFVMICGVLWMQACPAGSWDFLQVVSVVFMWLSLFQKKKSSVAIAIAICMAGQCLMYEEEQGVKMKSNLSFYRFNCILQCILRSGNWNHLAR